MDEKQQHPGELVDPIKVQDLDNILGQVWPVLDDGFVRAVDYMGGDAAIVQAARVSYGAGTKKVHEDRGLIRFLMRHRHTTPFEMCEIKLHVRVPMDCWRQWIRHRTASVNEYSTRYSEAIDACQTTRPDEWRSQSGSNKQGSEGMVTEYPEGWSVRYDQARMALSSGDYLSGQEEHLHAEARKVYEERLRFGVAREQARKDLPLSNYTEAYWKIDLHNLFHFLSLRMDAHAQLEIRSYADVIGHKIVAKWCPLAWEAFTDYRLNGMFLSGRDLEILQLINRGDFINQTKVAYRFGWLEEKKDGSLKSNRERTECEAKLEKLGLKASWLQ